MSLAVSPNKLEVSKVMHSKHSSCAFSLLVFLPLLFLPVLLTGQTAQVIPLKNWAAPLYWQPNSVETAERETIGSTGPGIRPLVTQLSTSALAFVAITPCRLVDTRGASAGFNGLSPFSGPSLAPSGTVTFPVQSAAEAIADTTPTPCGTVPSIAQAYSFNVTVIPNTAGGIAFVTIWPSGGAEPAVSLLNDGQGVILANAAIVPAGTPSGGVSVFNSGPATMDLIIDMNGYYAVTADITSVTAGTDLTGGGTGGAVTLNVDTTKIPTLAGGNTFTASNTFTGALSAGSLTVAGTAQAANLVAIQNVNFSGSVLYQGSPVLQFPGCGTNGVPLGSDTALGLGALQSDTTGGFNTGVGYGALQNDRPNCGASNAGSSNTAVGYQALTSNAAGHANTALGELALQNNTTGCCNIALGSQAGTSLSGGNSLNIDIGSPGGAGDGAADFSGVIRIGTIGLQTSFFVAGVRGVPTGVNDAIPVMIDSAGQLGTVSSSRRFKEDIEDMGEASRDLMRLRPVTFRYKRPFADGSKPVQYGLIAEEVDEVYPDLVAHSADGQIETVKYQVLGSMLLNEVQREQAEIGAQKEQLRRLEQQVSEQRQQNQSLQERLEKLEAPLTSTSSGSGAAAIR
jgi:hypothetical protein